MAGHSRRGIRSFVGRSTFSTNKSPSAAPVQRSAVSRAGSIPAASTTFDTLALMPNRVAPVRTSTYPRRWRVGAGRGAAMRRRYGDEPTWPRFP